MNHKMRHLLKKFPSKSVLKRVVSLPFSTQTQTRPEKLDRIATELLSLNAVELHDYSILFRLKMGLKNSAPGGISAGPGAAQGGGAEAAAAAAKEEKTVFDVKIEKFETAAKLKIVKEVRVLTGLGLIDAKNLVDKAPSIVKSGVSKEEGESIVNKLKELGATVVLE